MARNRDSERESSEELRHRLAKAERREAQHRQTEQKLREERDFSSAVLDTVAALIVVLDNRGRIIRFNRACEKLTGYAASEVLGREFWDILLIPEEVEPVREVFDHLVAGRFPNSYENYWRTKNGELRLISFTNTALTEDGVVTSVIATGLDITERKRAEEERERLLERLHTFNQRLVASNMQQQEATAESQRRAAELRAVIDNIVDAVFVVNTEGQLTLTNTAGAKLLGLKGTEGARVSLTSFPERLGMRHLNDTPATVTEMPLARALSGRTVVGEDYAFQDPETGQRTYARISAASIRDEAGEMIGAVAVARDITELIEVDRMKDEFIRVAAHELKTPVAIMKGYAQALMRAGERVTPQQRERMLDSINSGSDRITRIIEDLLDISQLQVRPIELHKETIDLSELVQKVLDRMAPLAPKHRLRITTAESVVVQGDRERLEQVMNHIIENAIKYSPKGGDIDVAIDTRQNEVVVSVTDHGVGIPKDRQEHIFERFYRAHAGTLHDYGGMGVGLYISNEIVQQHGGRMWFESEEGKGSTFHFSLPLAHRGPSGLGRVRRAERQT